LLPFVEQDAIWTETVKACHTDPNPNHNPPHLALPLVLAVYVCPDDDRLSLPLLDGLGHMVAFSSYLGVAGDSSFNGTLGMTPGIRLAEITDGTSQTLMVGERPPPGTLEAGNWYRQGGLDDVTAISGLPIPDDGCQGPFYFGPGEIQNRCDLHHFWSLHPGGANFVFADGSVHFITYDAAPIMPALATRNGGEPVSLPD
jgi:prepilin-type processing-associated H-X9-DG protein